MYGFGELIYSLSSVIEDPENVVIGAKEPSDLADGSGLESASR